MRTLVFVGVAVLLAACAYTVTVDQAPEIPTIPPMPTSTPAPTMPVSPLAEPAAIPLSAPATFTYDDLVNAAAEHGVMLKPGSYRCETTDGEYTFCRIVAPGLTREALCVWPGGADVCE